jgi:hypothetical protein|tara:strand:+ start:47 stop:313 length:267 start_codon:yes stop_codon:yes gene_type:complete
MSQQFKKSPAQRYGKLWNTISFNLSGARKKRSKDESQPIIGTLNIDNKRFDITWTEASRIIDELHDGQQAFNTATRIGMLDRTAGTHL